MLVKWSYILNKGDREINEDYCDMLEYNGNYCFVLADGLGAHDGGEVASKFVCNHITENFKQLKVINEGVLTDLINNANKSLIAMQKEKQLLNGLRTTVVVLIITTDEVYYGHVGDSRLYRFENYYKKFQSKDHSVCQKLVNIGEISVDNIRRHKDRSKLLSVLGQGSEITISNNIFSINESAFLLCSDGLWENVTETEMEIDLLKQNSPDKWLKQIGKRAIINAKGQMDNFSAIAVYINE
ncbi:MAG: PP2C family protein-serine/threonine phosphatase [Eubacteriales bacterium]